MKKTKKIIIVAALIVFALISGVFGYNKMQSKDAKPKGMFAIYIDEGDGNGPVASTSNVWPTEGYELDLETSFCDNGSTLSWDDTNKTVGVEATTGDKCKLYFIKSQSESGAETLIAKANAASVTTYSNGTTTEMYTFTHSDINTTLATQVSSWTSDELTDYRYIGADPSNYVYFNCTDTSDTSTCEVWRIIGVFTVEDEVGNKAQRIKLIRNATIGSLAWNSSGVIEWVGGSLATLLNSGDYYTRSNTYASNGLANSAKSMIDEKAKYYLGGYNQYDNLNGATYYSFERGETVYTGRSTSVVQEVGLMYPSDYVYTYANGVDSTCYTDAYDCDGGTPSTGWIYNTNTAEGSTSKTFVWTISPPSDGSYSAFYVFSTGYVDIYSYVYNTNGVRPVVYLNSDVRLDTTVGDGTSSSPYILEY